MTFLWKFLYIKILRSTFYIKTNGPKFWDTPDTQDFCLEQMFHNNSL